MPNPVIGDHDVSHIDTDEIMKVLEPIWSSKTEAATRLRGCIESILAWATVKRYRSGLNPARWKGHLDQLQAKPTRIRWPNIMPRYPMAKPPTSWCACNAKTEAQPWRCNSPS